jgi:hypothetical protein
VLQTCRLYGLGVQVDVPLAALATMPPAERVDVEMRFAPPPHEGAGVRWTEYYASPEMDDRGVHHIRVWRRADPDVFRIDYEDGTRVHIEASGRRVWAVAPPGVDVEDTATYLLGPTLGFVLRLRGVTCLHASAVAIGGAAVVLVGASGFGKSSLAAAFAQRGYAILSDDVVALADDGERFSVRAAYPRIRLWPHSVDSLFGHSEALPRITPGWDKRFLSLDGARYRFQAADLPLRGIYLLGDRDTNPGAPAIRPMEGHEALLHLVGNTYTTYLLDRGMRAREFEVLARLARHVAVRRATPSARFDRIHELCAAIESDLDL